jgi:hypothetical protein
MLYCYSVFPFSPLEGKSIWNWSKPVWAIMFFPGIGLFVAWELGLLSGIVFISIGLIALLSLIYVFIIIAREPLPPPVRKPPEVKTLLDRGVLVRAESLIDIEIKRREEALRRKLKK